jgi:hypothetical protein
MPNPDRPSGFEYKWRMGGGVAQRRRYALATTNEPLAKGDLVSLMAAGSVDRTVLSDGAHGETTCIGVCESILYMDSSGMLNHHPYVAAAQGNDTTTLTSGAGAIVDVIIDPMAVYSVQCDDGGSVAVSQALIGTTGNPIAAAGTDPTQVGRGGHSIMEIDTSDLDQTAGLFHVIGLDTEVGMVFSSTEADSRFGRLLVMFNEHLFMQTPTAAGV